MVRLMVVCYLTVASIAAAHALPNLTLGSTAGGGLEVSISQSANCHQAESQTITQQKTSLCEIFCAATGQALQLTHLSVIADIFNPSKQARINSALLSRALAVEPHPPKPSIANS